MQGGFGAFSSLPSLTMLQKKVLWFWPWNPVLHQWELGVVALGRGNDISYFSYFEMIWISQMFNYPS